MGKVYCNIIFGTVPRWVGWAESANYTHADGAAPSHGPGNNALIYVCKTMTGGGRQHHEKVVCKRYIGTIYYIIHTNAHRHPLRGIHCTHLNDGQQNFRKEKTTLL